MKTQLRQATDIAHALTIRGGAKRAGWALAAVGSALLTMSATAVAAPAPPGGLVNPLTLPDLSVTLSAPATINSYSPASLTFNVTNSPPSTVYRVGGSTLVRAHADLTGLIATSATSDAGLNCTVSTANPDTPWTVVDCIGTLAWGASTTITVQFQPATGYSAANSCNHDWYCGEPMYADVSVVNWSGGSERSLANNRAIGRIDTDGCIN